MAITLPIPRSSGQPIAYISALLLSSPDSSLPTSHSAPLCMDPLPSFGDLLSSLSLSERADQSIPDTTRSRSESQSSISSIVSTSLRTPNSSSSDMLDDHLDSPPPDISSIAGPSRSMRLAKSRSIGRLRGSRYAPYQVSLFYIDTFIVYIILGLLSSAQPALLAQYSVMSTSTISSGMSLI